MVARRKMEPDGRQGGRLLRLPEVMSRTGYGKTRIYELIRQGLFPPPIRLGPNSVAWVEREVDAWIEQKIYSSRHGVTQSNNRTAHLSG